MSIATLDNYTIIILCETFGGTFCPYRFTDVISEPITNLDNDLLSYIDWNKNNVFYLI